MIMLSNNQYENMNASASQENSPPALPKLDFDTNSNSQLFELRHTIITTPRGVAIVRNIMHSL
jgi:hypothetical protein